MFSSGTTGKPNCMVQSAGGVLINHLKELLLHPDLRRSDVITYVTTCSWMMWNWLLSSLAVGAAVLLYDGSPTYPDSGAMWKLIADERVTIFGTSATYLNALRTAGVRPGREHDVSSLREISQTGSPLSAEGFEYVYRDIGGITFMGRSDAALKPGGVRIGTAEIYRILEQFPEVADRLVVGQSWRGDQRIVLVVKVAAGGPLTAQLRDAIRTRLRMQASPRHVPAVVLAGAELSYNYHNEEEG